MFQSALRTKSENTAPEVENLGLEACVEEIKSKLALIERLEFACESFAALPDNAVTPLTVSLFASSFVDVDAKFVPEFSHKSLESSIATSGKEAKAFALESGEGVIARIWQFIKNLIKALAEVISNLYYRIVGRNKQLTQEDKTSTAEVKETVTQGKKQKELDKVTIKVTQNFACFFINGQMSFGTIDKVFSEAYSIAAKASSASKIIKTELTKSLSQLKQVNKPIEEIFQAGWEIELTPKTDYPGHKKIVYEPFAGTFFKLVKDLDHTPDKANVVSSVSEFVIERKDFGKIEHFSNLGARDTLALLFLNMKDLTVDLREQSKQIFEDNDKSYVSTGLYNDYLAFNRLQKERLNSFRESLRIIPDFTSAISQISQYLYLLDEGLLAFKDSFVKNYRIQLKQSQEQTNV